MCVKFLKRQERAYSSQLVELALDKRKIQLVHCDRRGDGFYILHQKVERLWPVSGGF